LMYEEKIKNHWYPETPNKGHAHRSISLDRLSKPEPILLRAATAVGINVAELLSCVPTHVESIWMWVDPGEVTVRVFSFTEKPREETLFKLVRKPQLKPTPQKNTPIHHMDEFWQNQIRRSPSPPSAFAQVLPQQQVAPSRSVPQQFLPANAALPVHTPVVIPPVQYRHFESAPRIFRNSNVNISEKPVNTQQQQVQTQKYQYTLVPPSQHQFPKQFKPQNEVVQYGNNNGQQKSIQFMHQQLDSTLSFELPQWWEGRESIVQA